MESARIVCSGRVCVCVCRLVGLGRGWLGEEVTREVVGVGVGGLGRVGRVSSDY